MTLAEHPTATPTNALHTDDDPIAQAERVGPLLRRNAAEADRAGRLPAESVQALREAGLFRLYVPRSLGGLEVDPLTHACVQEELARHDSAAAWALQAAGSGAWWCSRLPAETAKEIYRDGPDRLLAVSFPIPMEAARVDGGFRLSGRRGFASNVSDAAWIWVTATVQDETVGGEPVTRAAFFPAGDARIVRTWDTLGMRGTDSNDVELDRLFVPERRTFRIGTDHTPNSLYEGPLYRAAAMVLVASYIPPVALGIARDALAELLAIAHDKTPFASTMGLRNRAVAQSKLGRAEGALRSAETYLHDRISYGWDRAVAGGELALEEKAEVLLAAAQAVDASARAVEAAFSAAGTTAIKRGGRLEQHLRDISVLKQQGFVSASRFETVAQVLLGLPPDLGFVAL
jgi:alkylation response protein AidB-like acyl-CoA dehydrogenase